MKTLLQGLYSAPDHRTPCLSARVFATNPPLPARGIPALRDPLHDPGINGAGVESSVWELSTTDHLRSGRASLVRLGPVVLALVAA